MAALTVIGLTPSGAATLEQTPSPGDSAPAFLDVGEDNVFFSDIQWMSEMGLSTGYIVAGGAEYHPVEDVSRQAMAAFLYRFSGEDFTPPSTPSFSDVPQSNTFYAAVEWMKERGITTGYADGGFHPIESVSRQAMAAFLSRYGIVPPTTGSGTFFADVPTANPFAQQIEWMRLSGITTGYIEDDGTTTFHPEESVSRQAMAAFLHRYVLRPAESTPTEYTLDAGATEAAVETVTAVSIGAPTTSDGDGDGVVDGPDTATSAVTLAPGAAAPTVGSGFVLPIGTTGAESGLVGRVGAVAATAEGGTVVTVEPAPLDSVFDTLTLAYDGPVELDVVVPGQPFATTLAPESLGRAASPGEWAEATTRQSDAATPGVTCLDAKGQQVAFTNKNSMEVGLEFENTRVSFVLDLGNPVVGPSMDLRLYTEPVVSLEAKLTVALNCRVEGMPKPEWYFAGGAVSVAVAPYITFSVSGSASFVFEKRFYRTAGFAVEPDGRAVPYSSAQSAPMTAEVTASATLTMTAGGQFEIRAFGVAAVYLKVGPEGKVTATAVAGSDPSLCLHAEYSLAVATGAYLDVWVKKWQYSFSDQKFPLASEEFCWRGADLPDRSAPTISAVSPGTMPLAGGRARITGTGLSDIVTASVGGVEATSIRVSSDTSALVVLPPMGEGTYPLVLTSPQGSSDEFSLSYSASVALREVKFSDVSAGEFQSYAVDRDGDVWEWGIRGTDEGNAKPGDGIVFPQPILGLSDIVEVSGGYSHGLAVDGNGRVFGWGSNGNGEVDEEISPFTYYRAAVPIDGVPTAVAVAAGANISFAVTRDGSVYGWGTGVGGTPTRIEGLARIVDIDATDGHVVVVDADGLVFHWEEDVDRGGIASGLGVGGNGPSVVAGLPPIASVTAGVGRTVAVARDGSTYSWTVNVYNGAEGGSIRSDPVPVGLSDVAKADAGWGAQNMAISSTGSLSAWGEGALGTGNAVEPTPALVGGLPPVVAVGAGGNFTTAISTGGDVYTWGSADRLGDGSTSDRQTPGRIVVTTAG
ncbi:hypothetical protein GSU68_03235 [Rathayibacter sp. VKM Ac-2759]|nr:hypothetical protein GSU68_03235 [Rathayibacter sp. VKM Ac-2759]